MASPQGVSAAAVRLSASLDLKAAAPLLQSLLAARGQDLVVEAGEVARLGGQCLQVLLSARQTWARDGHAFEIRDPSPAFQDAAALMGAGDLLGLEPCQ
jgi:chemotaxis protein CheX